MKFLSVLFVMLAAIALDGGAIDNPPFYVNISGFGEYKVHASYRSYSGAVTSCEEEGADLASPATRQEQDAIIDMVYRYSLPSTFWVTCPQGTESGQRLRDPDCCEFITSGRNQTIVPVMCRGGDLGTYLCKKRQ